MASIVVTSRTFGLHGEHETRPDRGPVHQHGAGTAHPVLATQMRPRQVALFTKEVGQGQPGLHQRLSLLAVDHHPYDHLTHYVPP